MLGRDRKANFTLLAVIAAVLLALSTRNFGSHDPLVNSYHRIFLCYFYIALLAGWGVSLHRRILQRGVRRCLIGIALLMVFWIFVRTVKNELLIGLDTDQRYCWYLYYLPMLGIPMLSFWASLTLGKPADYRLPRRVKLLLIPFLALLAAVLTNDLHQRVFRFRPDLLDWSADYHYGTVYLLCFLWMSGLELLSLVLTFRSCGFRRNGGRIVWMPLTGYAAAFVFAVLYIRRVPFFFANDMTVCFCLMTGIIIESTIQTGLIRSNTHYGALFSASSLAARITDDAGTLRYASANAGPLPAETLLAARRGPVTLTDDLRLKSAPIGGGWVFWQEDVSARNVVLRGLREAGERAREANELLREEYAVEHQRLHVAEQNRLYDKMHLQTAPQILLLTQMTAEYPALAEDAAAVRALLARMSVVGAYLKRRNNLIFIAEQRPVVPALELLQCLQESVGNLTLCGADCALSFELEGSVLTVHAMLVYDLFEAVVEGALSALCTLLTRVYTDGGDLCVSLALEASAPPDFPATSAPILAALREAGAELSAVGDEDGAFCVSMRIPEGGEAV